MKRSILIISLVIALVGISAFLSVMGYNETKKVLSYFEDNNEHSALLKMVNDQYDVNNKLSKAINNRKYTLDNAYVELNPYGISPLSAIIIFSTPSETEVQVYVNNVYMTTMESGKKHSIPIYGMYEDYENIIKLVTKDTEKEYVIKTNKSNLAYPLDVKKTSGQINSEEMYFTVASYETWLTGWDSSGKLRFYLTEDMRMDVEWLDNGHFIIGTSIGQYAENFLGFFEMDYLGKIYNYYTMEHGFSFESQILKNGNIMSAGGDTPVYFNHQVIYEMNPTTGKTVAMVDLYDIFKSIDETFPDKYLAQAAIRNGFYYHEETDELVISFRGINTVFSINFKTKQLNWIFTSPENEVFKNEVWEQYLVKSDKFNYPWGQHSPQITKDGYIAFFNNGYDRYLGFENGYDDQVASYKDNYSRAEIYEIKNMKANLVWKYDGNKKYFSHQYGSFRELDNGNRFINFGYVLKDNYRQNQNATLSEAENNPEHIYSFIIELDKDDNVLFEATCEEGKYRAFKHHLYNKTTSNVDVTLLNIFNSIPDSALDEANYHSLDLESATNYLYTVEFTKNTFTTNYDILSTDDIKLYFLNKTGKIYTLNYKDANNPQLKRIFNINLSGGAYALFIGINDQLYKTNQTINF